MIQATLSLDTQHHAGPIDPRIFGGFLEHLGRAVYEGVYDPGNPLSDENGFRRDVLAALKRLRMPLVRYPGGNFVSAYDWKDGIGPRDQRPVRPDFAWRSIEPNTFGLDEMAAWCRELGTAPMMAVNLGTLGGVDAAAIVEYCNLPVGTAWADRRAANGRREPHAFKVWCLGNEMDGPWQAGHVPADVYAQRAQQAAKLMSGLDPTIELVACGSSGRFMATYMEWDRTVLEYCWNDVHYVSAHRYSENRRNDTAWFLAEGVEIDRIIADYAGLFDYVRGLRRAQKRVFLSFDEWNVWYKDTGGDGGWRRAPRLLEEVYNLEDALVCAQYLNAFIRRADVVKIACIAQIVNVIAPILTRRDGILIQPIFYPFELMAAHTAGISLRPVLTCPTYRAGDRGDVPTLDVSASLAPDGALAVFAVNRTSTQPATLTVRLADAAIERIAGVDALSGADPKAVNTWERPDVVRPRPGTANLSGGGAAEITVPPLGFVAFRAATRKR
ncbi:MAG TPA: alpha-L-arabinofuranosidase C-terminal domain-containing protein [Chthonomonadales bacterium]|nr:alpha-L-arabinofuranosidase C-terminal domain-containing protein [Chthonomonadales bacterium]